MRKLLVSVAMLAVGILVSCGTTDNLENSPQESAPVYYERIYLASGHVANDQYDVKVALLGAVDGFEFYRTYFDYFGSHNQVSLIVVDTSQSFENDFFHSYLEGNRVRDKVDSGSVTWALTDKAFETFNHWDTFFKTGITHVLAMFKQVNINKADVSPLGKVTWGDSSFPVRDVVGTDSEPFEFVCSKVDIYLKHRWSSEQYLVKVKDENTKTYHVAKRYTYEYEINYDVFKGSSYNPSFDDETALSGLSTIGYIDADGFLVEKSITLQELHDKIVDYMKSTENRIFSVEDNAGIFEPRNKYFFKWYVSVSPSCYGLLPDGSVLY